MKPAIPVVAAMMLLAPFCLRADELKLKDGTKIVGTIVGFEENSFKVKTSYGYAVVQKDQVISISIADSGKKPEAAKESEATKSSDAPKKTQPAAKAAFSAGSSNPALSAPGGTQSGPTAQTAWPSASKPAPARTIASAAVSIGDASKPSATVANSDSPATAPSGRPAAATPPSIVKPPAPEPIREEVVGNSYVNDTYGFRMYKPPDWELIVGARTLLPGAITAMGTGDQTTYLLIGQDLAGKSLASDMDATEARLRDVMDNFRPLGEKRITISGVDAVEQRFRGSVDAHEWSGTVVLVPRGGKIYTIFGMTYADTDLVQIQENVIARAISSLQFTK
jgi:hypothetical protein